MKKNEASICVFVFLTSSHNFPTFTPRNTIALTLKEKLNITELTETVEVNIRFSETDPMGIVWHGNYLKYLEDGREAFGAKYGIGYMDIYKQGFAAPLVEIDIKYKKALRYGESILIETKYVHDDAAKIIFAYKVMNAKRQGEIIATANSIQVFLDLKGGEKLYCGRIWKKKI